MATVKKAAPGCSGQPAVLDQLSGEFASPGFGNGHQYAADLSCSWLIVTDPGTVRLHLCILALRLNPAGCSFDGSAKLLRIGVCGNGKKVGHKNIAIKILQHKNYSS